MSSEEKVDLDDKIDMSLDQIIDMEKKDSRRHSRERSSHDSPYERPRRRSRSSSISPSRNNNKKRVYVGNIAWETSWQDLKDHMKQVGEVAYANIFQNGNRSKGCGIVEFETEESAKRAIDELNDTKINGVDRLIFVREDRGDRERNHSPHSYRDRGSRRTFSRNDDRYDRHDRHNRYDRHDRHDRYDRYDRHDRHDRHERHRHDREGRQLFVDNLPYTAKWYDLKDYFRTFGNVEKADIIQGRDGRSAGRGTVLFEKSSDMRYALRKAHETEFKGRKIYVKEDKFADR